MTMRIHTDLTPQDGYTDVVLVVDVLRASTVAPLLFERGLEQLALTPSLRSARGATKDGWLLLGERQGVPPEGFNYGTSPAQLASMNMAGRRAVMVTENAPRSMPKFDAARHVLLASFYNAAAAADAAAALAHERVDLVCCGFEGEPDLDDTLAAGLLAGLLAERFPTALRSGATRFTLTLLRAFPDPVEALWQSIAGHYLRSLDLPHDMAVAARTSASDVVPSLRERVPGSGSAPLYVFAPHR
jgi:2-phosphosulfolactate phosphatase